MQSSQMRTAAQQVPKAQEQRRLLQLHLWYPLTAAASS
jgi:hypothetical protein